MSCDSFDIVTITGLARSSFPSIAFCFSFMIFLASRLDLSSTYYKGKRKEYISGDRRLRLMILFESQAHEVVLALSRDRIDQYVDWLKAERVERIRRNEVFNNRICRELQTGGFR